MTSSRLSEFLAMGGYGFYVWTSYIVAACAIVIEIIAVRARMRTAMRSAVAPGDATLLSDDTQ